MNGLDEQTETKWLLKSKTIIGLVVLLAGPWLNAHRISADDLNTIAGQAITLFGSASTFVGAVLVLYGRYTAKQTVTLLPSK